MTRRGGAEGQRGKVGRGSSAGGLVVDVAVAGGGSGNLQGGSGNAGWEEGGTEGGRARAGRAVVGWPWKGWEEVRRRKRQRR